MHARFTGAATGRVEVWDEVEGRRVDRCRRTPRPRSHISTAAINGRAFNTTARTWYQAGYRSDVVQPAGCVDDAAQFPRAVSGEAEIRAHRCPTASIARGPARRRRLYVGPGVRFRRQGRRLGRPHQVSLRRRLTPSSGPPSPADSPGCRWRRYRLACVQQCGNSIHHARAGAKEVLGIGCGVLSRGVVVPVAVHSCVPSYPDLIDSVDCGAVEPGMGFCEPDDGGVLVRSDDPSPVVSCERRDRLADAFSVSRMMPPGLRSGSRVASSSDVRAAAISESLAVAFGRPGAATTPSSTRSSSHPSADTVMRTPFPS